ARQREGSISALRQFQTREAAQGTRFHYASSETVILAVLLRAVTGATLSEYLTTRLWQPMGAEADATWIRTMDALECCWPMTARPAASRSCRKIISSMRPTGTANRRRSSRERPRRISDM